VVYNLKYYFMPLDDRHSEKRLLRDYSGCHRCWGEVFLSLIFKGIFENPLKRRSTLPRYMVNGRGEGPKSQPKPRY